MKSEIKKDSNGDITISYKKCGQTKWCWFNNPPKFDANGNILENNEHVFLLIRIQHYDFETEFTAVVSISHSLKKIQDYIENNPIEHDDNILDGEEYELDYIKLL